MVRVELLVSGILEGQVEAVEAMAVEEAVEVRLLPRIGEIALAVQTVLVV